MTAFAGPWSHGRRPIKGFEDRQAEGLARALASEITEHVVIRADLGAAIALVRGDYRTLDESFCNKSYSVDARFDSVDSRIDALDAKFEASFNALSVQTRFIFAMPGVLVVPGLADRIPALLA